MRTPSFLTRLTGFRRDERGATATIFAVAAVPIFAFVGLSVDYGASLRQKTKLKTTLDAAVLSGLSDQMGGRDPAATINAFVQNKFQGTGYTPNVTVTVGSGDGTLSATANFDMMTSFMSLIGYPTVNITARSAAAAGAGSSKFEVAIAFDTTGSMEGTKLSSAQSAANQLLDTLYAVPGSSATNPNMKVGLVPFAAYVNVGLQYRNASWLNNANDYSQPNSGCWDTYPNATYSNPVQRTGTCYRDSGWYSCSWTDYTVDYGTPVNVCSSWTDDYIWTGCVGSQDATHDASDTAMGTNKVPPMFNKTCAAPLIRLTNDKAALKASVNAMTADGYTYIPAGLLWGWRLLSPNQNAPFQDGLPYDQSNKILILLTDGANTRSAQYSTGDHEGSDVSAANSKVLEICQNVKSTGIQVYTIAFDVTDSTIQSVLSQCSSGPPFYYNAQTVADLQGAFKSIGAKLAGIRLTE